MVHADEEGPGRGVFFFSTMFPLEWGRCQGELGFAYPSGVSSVANSWVSYVKGWS